ncbi:MAG: 4-hydroxy-tetrahydrodipicolinate reductase [Oscillospiraceae bacterium]|jgi:4-hydroxy-tetrahydrodipicolinate reductase|nr:4-hydroxy-tetrahydrodipicolinate reductase [Oscillospiraceae bacterium]
MLNLILSGAGGKLARCVAECAYASDDCKVICGIDPFVDPAAYPFPVVKTAAETAPYIEGTTVLFDASLPSVLPTYLPFVRENRLPTVIATTGYGEAELSQLDAAKADIPIFYGRNMSLGVAVLKELAKTAARILGNSFDIEIIEAHHNKKVDAPSGTALILAEAINEGLSAPRPYCFDRTGRSEPRPKNEIGIHAVRGGTITGDHVVLFAGYDETITLSHHSGSRKLFAAGCLSAVRFTAAQAPGLYGMEDMTNFCV